jgi:hypothetical protein
MTVSALVVHVPNWIAADMVILKSASLSSSSVMTKRATGAARVLSRSRLNRVSPMRLPPVDPGNMVSHSEQ